MTRKWLMIPGQAFRVRWAANGITQQVILITGIPHHLSK
jgi:hypothetical protein